MNVRWVCPNGCGGVIGPSRPRRDDVRRYCLECSARTGRLVRRVAPSLEKKREIRAEKRAEREKLRAEREAEREASRYVVDGFDVRAELVRLWNTKARRDRRPNANPPPILEIRRCSRRPSFLYGSAIPHLHTIRVSVWPGLTREALLDTLAHEVAHMLAPHTSHGVAWRTAFRVLCEEAYGVRIVVNSRLCGALERALVAKKKKIAEEIPPEIVDAIEGGLMQSDPHYEWLEGKAL